LTLSVIIVTIFSSRKIVLLKCQGDRASNLQSPKGRQHNNNTWRQRVGVKMIDTENAPITVLIVDSQNLIRTGLRLILESQPEISVIGEACDTKEAREKFSALKPDIILVNMEVDELKHNLISCLLNNWNHSRIIILARREDANICVKAVEEGALGIVFKSVQADVLIKAIQKVHSGEVWIEHSMIANLLMNISRAKLNKANDPETERIMQLSNRERQVIQLIGRGMKNKQIAVLLCISETTVRHHLTSVYEKLCVNDRLELLVYANRYHLA
jgi:DNA-binding NarL/FixJ family response regulator